MTLSKSRRFARAAALSACVAAVGLAGAASPAQAKTFSCTDLTVKQNPANTYLTGIVVTGRFSSKTSACKSGRSLALAYNKCRRKKGVRGSCSGQTVNGLKCKEKRNPDLQLDTEINATVTCTKGSKKIVHNWQYLF